MPNASKHVFSVIMVCITMAIRIILRQWKTVNDPELKERASAVVEIASFES